MREEKTMLKSCQYCGRIHDAKKACTEKKQAEDARWRNRKNTKAAAFRKTAAWTDASRSVRQRDNYMCLCCKAELPATRIKYNTENLSVHHIVPLEEDYSLRLSRENLMTVCGTHHEMCEAGVIDRDTQRALVEGAMRAAGEDGGALLVL